MINKCIFVGRLTRDPKLRYTPNGVAVANFTLAVNRIGQQQEGQPTADFPQFVVWQKQAENVANYLKKGSQAGVVARVQTRSYDNNEGQKVFVTEFVAESVQFLEPRGSQGNDNGTGNTNTSGSSYNGTGGQNGAYGNDPFANNGRPIDISDDDLPF